MMIKETKRGTEIIYLIHLNPSRSVRKRTLTVVGDPKQDSGQRQPPERYQIYDRRSLTLNGGMIEIFIFPV